MQKWGFGRWLRVPGIYPLLLSAPEVSKHEHLWGRWVPCLPVFLPFSSELVLKSHPSQSHPTRTQQKHLGEDIYLIWGVGYCCLCQCVKVVGRQPEGLLSWSKRLFWPQAAGQKAD